MPALRVLALATPGRHGNDAVLHARALTAAEPAIELTVVALAPVADGPRCGTSILDFNAAAGEAAREDLERARTVLSDRAAYALISERDASALTAFVNERGIELVLLPGRHGRHTRARRLRAGTAAEVRVVGGAPIQPLPSA